MGEVLPFKKPKKKPKGMCQHGFHKFEALKNTRFDVNEGKLITRYRCVRCGLEKVSAD